jgi:transcriptional regulator of acetoin/glycerol metabolism
LDAQRLAERSYAMGSFACHEAIGRSLTLPETLNVSELEKAALKKALEVAGNPMAAAKLLGIGKTTVYRKAKQYGFLTGTGAAFCPNCGRRMSRPAPQLASAA